MRNDAILKEIREEANQYGFGMRIEEMANQIYWALRSKGYDVYILNERYISCEGNDYQILKTRSKGCWTVKAF